MYHHSFLLLLVLNLSVTVLAGDKISWPCFHDHNATIWRPTLGLCKRGHKTVQSCYGRPQVSDMGTAQW